MKLAVLISGRGSNLAALLDASAKPGYPAHVALVLSNRSGADGLATAAAAGIATAVVPHTDYPTREAFDDAVDGTLRDAGIELVALAGFMRILTPGFVRRWEGRLLNIHPSLLPSFRGLHAHAQALKTGVRIAGCSAHFVVPEIDAGPVIAQAAVPVLPGDDEATLASRVLHAEHALYPHAVGLVASGTVRYSVGAAHVTGAPQLAMFLPDV